MMYKVLVTGSAGFIGFHVVSRLLKKSQIHIIGLDSINDYYDISLKYGRLSEHGIECNQLTNSHKVYSKKYPNYTFFKGDIADSCFMTKLFNQEKFDYVIHLAGQAGVRYSLTSPHEYITSNIQGFLNILEGVRHNRIKHLVYASTSSVYGLNTTVPFSEKQPTNHPISLYAATKKSNELMAHSYSHLFGIPTTGLRFFTVYGPWGRPDMALFSFANSIIRNKAIDVFNNGNMIRDFTYIDDVIESIERVIFSPAEMNREWSSDDPLPDSSSAPYKIYNVGNGQPSSIISYISALEKALGKRALINFKELQPGDVLITHADSSSLLADIDFKPNTTIEEGVNNFVNWFKVFYKV